MDYACIGEHLKHSFSKEIHNALGDYQYEIKEVSKDALDKFMTEKDFLGINVTIPYKEAVIPYLYELDASAKAIGAVNTVVNRNGRLYGYNTDFYGMTMLFRHIGIDPCNKKVLILGTGGTSKTAYTVLGALGAGEVFTVSRSGKNGALTYEEAYKKHGDAETIVNTTPSGMFPEIYHSPIDVSKFSKLSGVVDAVYNPIRSELISAARRLGIPAEGGLYMLVAQAVRASEIFLGKEYPAGVLESVYKNMLLEKENIVLTGMPGAGKTTVGKLLSEQLGREFLDTDTIIEEKIGMPIKDFFEKFGEKEFRIKESEAIKEVSKNASLIIATGGGAILREENVNALKMNGKIFFLDRCIDDIIPTESRPLSSDRKAREKRYSERYPIYIKTADKRIKIEGTALNTANLIKEEFEK